MSENSTSTSGLPTWKKAGITFAFLAAAGAFIFSQLPQDIFPTDLSRIGQGTPALAVARNINFAAGADVMALISSIRSEYTDQVQFLAVHLGHPDGQAFARKHAMEDGTVVLFAGDGSAVAILHAPTDTAQLRRLLETSLYH